MKKNTRNHFCNTFPYGGLHRGIFAFVKSQSFESFSFLILNIEQSLTWILLFLFMYTIVFYCGDTPLQFCTCSVQLCFLNCILQSISQQCCPQIRLAKQCSKIFCKWKYCFQFACLSSILHIIVFTDWNYRHWNIE